MKTKGLMAVWRVIPFRWLFSLYVFIAVLHIFLRATVQGKPVSVDASKFHINPLECYDRITSCKGEVDQGFCVTNSQYMIDRCPWSCHFCRRAEGDTTKCQDLSDSCSAWVSREECKTRPEFMAQNCKRSCKLCGNESEFTDLETGCHIWAKSGGCQKYPELVQKCPYSCQKYAGLVPSTQPELSNGLQNTSSLELQNSSQVSAPTIPLATIRTNPDLQRLPEELQKDLEKDWWREKLFSLTKKQNEYVTHLEPPPPSLPMLSRVKNESLSANETRGRNDSVVIVVPDEQDGNQQNANQTQAPPLAPRTYDSLVPQLVVGTPTWSSETGNEKNFFSTTDGQMTTKNPVGLWAEEQEEDQDLDENGEEKGRVPPRLRGQRKRLKHDKNKESFPSSGSGDNEEEKEPRGDTQDIGKNKGQEIKKIGWRLNFSGSGDDSRNLKTYRVLHVPGENQERYFEKWGKGRFASGNGKREGARKAGTRTDLFKSKQITASRKLGDHSYFSAIGEDENEGHSEIDLSSSGGT